MVHSVFRPRTGAISTAVFVALVIWFLVDAQGTSRLWTVILAFVVAYLTFNATTTYLDIR